jgi:nucleoside-diphosphate-sugar epimerase
VYAGRTETRWHEELALPAAELPHLIVAFKKAVEPLTTHSLHGSGVQPVVLRIGTIWGPLVDPESPFFPIPSYISAVLRGEEPRPLHARLTHDTGFAPTFDVATAVADYVAWRADNPR